LIKVSATLAPVKMKTYPNVTTWMPKKWPKDETLSFVGCVRFVWRNTEYGLGLGPISKYETIRSISSPTCPRVWWNTGSKLIKMLWVWFHLDFDILIFFKQHKLHQFDKFWVHSSLSNIYIFDIFHLKC